MEDPLARLPKALLHKDPLAYVRLGAEAWRRELRGSWLLGVASGFLWPEAPPPKDPEALFRRMEGAWQEAEAYFWETGLDFPLLVSEWAREALEPLLHRKRLPPYPSLRGAFARGLALGRRVRGGLP
ncbi:hypothetical protein SAMN04488243_10621 [Thermus arciformis]|uniref:Uncharacterized protein n=1 Tax=Thermus arciformis TaxID=482827 RepID=A0A1G7ENY2_9DEIN|nr:hypothetical protein [Thermus arciformis]SDE65085.1 hypothetical protein SAMN04488243_10621 [Thermus arciformis]